MEENDTVYGTIIALLRAPNSSLLPVVPRIIDIFSQVLGNPNVQPHVQQEIVITLKGLLTQYPVQMQEVVNTLEQSKKDNLIKYLQ